MSELIPSMEGGSGITAVLLAAGMSRRLAYPKQTLIYEGQSLIRRQLQILQASPVDRVYVVTGAYRQACVAEIEDLPDWHEIFHPDFQLGMGSSIKAAVHHIVNHLIVDRDQLRGIMFVVCDQIHLTSQHLNHMIKMFQLNCRENVASSYGKQLGIPAIFPRERFADLLRINDQQGAKVILKNFGCVCVDFPGGEVDIDRPEDILSTGAKTQGS
ncbi:MAG: nucleotidyltransferase family protein [Oligoflexus sp.]